MRHISLVFTASILAVAQMAFAGSPAPQHPVPSHHPARRPSSPALPPVALPAEPGLYAVIYTSMGNIVCRLFDKDAPKAVANFRGLATGTKAWTDPRTGRVRHAPLYSGTVFHRVIPQFMIQGGDPLGNGTGDPGYKFEDEFNPAHTFDKPGILAMANSGPDTNGSQFFITVAPTPWLNGKHTIFGEVVAGQDVADKISQVPRDSDDKPLTPIKLIRISIRRVPSAAPVMPHRPSSPTKG
ncbi:MAG TPA: peptidylprolyl isomerase [Bryobacteraceae bacterium]|nr:peptidylprolyl isomerase [Bryobacteraceae bacterium]